MGYASAGELVADLRAFQVLEPARLEETARRTNPSGDPNLLTRDLLERHWLTPFQANLLLQGRGPELVFGSYVLIARAGVGGMGHVFKARHQKLGHVVALKIIRKDRLSNPAAVERFKRELSAAPLVSHPNVVAAYDAGEHQGTLFLAMEFVDGIDLGKLVASSGPLPVIEACEYARQTADGLTACHEGGLVHRDIKPRNLFLTRVRSAAGEGRLTPLIKILDLGLARVDPVHSPATGRRLTQLGKVVGTADYIAPEQARDAHHVDGRADLYSLGCTLYFLLAGKPPFSGGSKVERIVSHMLEEAPRLERVRAEVPEALAAVVRKLLAKEPDDRYQTAAEVVAALTPFIVAVPVAPAPVASVARVSPTRQRGAEAVGLEDSTHPTPEAHGRQSVGLVNHEDSTHPTAAADPDAPIVALPPRRAAPTTRGRIILLSAIIGGMLIAGLVVGVLALANSSPEQPIRPVVHAPGSPPASIPVVARPAAHQREAAPLPMERKPVAALPDVIAVVGDPRRRQWGPVQCVAQSLDGTLIASGGHDNRVRVWDAETGRERAAFRMAGSGIASVAFQTDGKLVAVSLRGNKPADVRQWDQATGEARAVDWPVDAAASVAELSPDGRILAAHLWQKEQGGAAGRVILWDLASAKQIGKLDVSAPINVLAWSRDGRTLALAAGKTVKIWTIATAGLTAEWPAHDAAVTCLALSADGTRAASASTQWSRSAGGEVRAWDTKTGERVASFRVAEPVASLAFSPRGSVIAAGTGQAEVGRIVLHDLAGDGTPRILDGHGGPVTSLAFSADAATLSSGSSDHSVRLWDVSSGKEKHPLPRVHGPATAVAFAPEGGLAMLTGPWQPHVRWLDVASGKERNLPTGHRGGVTAIGFRADGKRLAAWGPWGATTWETATGELAGRLRAPGDTRLWGDLDPDGRTVAAAGKDGVIQLWDLLAPANATAPRRTLPGHKAALAALAFASDGKTLATAGVDQTVKIWDLAAKDSSPRVSLPKQQAPVVALAFSADSRLLAAAFRDGAIKLWTASDGAEQATLTNPAGTVNSLMFSPDGKILAAWSVHGLRLWDVAAKKELPTAPKHAALLRAFAFAPDSRRVATGDEDGRVCITRIDTGDKPADWQLGGAVHAVAFVPDGRHVATANGNGSAYLFRLGPPPGSIARAAPKP